MVRSNDVSTFRHRVTSTVGCVRLHHVYGPEIGVRGGQEMTTWHPFPTDGSNDPPRTRLGRGRRGEMTRCWPFLVDDIVGPLPLPTVRKVRFRRIRERGDGVQSGVTFASADSGDDADALDVGKGSS